MSTILRGLAERRPLLLDSATGTWFQQRFGVDQVGGECCDGYNVSHPEVVRELYRAKVLAGAELILTNTFNSNPLRLREFELDRETERFNCTGVSLLRDVIAESNRQVFVGGNVGPTGKLVGLSATYDEVFDSMYAQIRALVRTGIDILCIETTLQSIEAEIATKAAREAFTEEGVEVPIYVTFSFVNRPEGRTEAYRTFFGDTVRDIMEGKRDLLADREGVGVVALGVDVVGANCSIGIEEAVCVAEEFSNYISGHGLRGRFFVAAKPNARVMATMAYEDPAFVAARFERLVAAGADLVGFCCGSMPEHVAAVARRRREMLGF